jgi:hypothetical protein
MHFSIRFVFLVFLFFPKYLSFFLFSLPLVALPLEIQIKEKRA